MLNNPDQLRKIAKRFTFLKVKTGFDEVVPPCEIRDRLVETYETSVIAECIPCQDTDCTIGIMCIVYHPEEFTNVEAAHESVHIADYFVEDLGITTEHFSDGDEQYAYLVGWVMSQFIKAKEEYDSTNKRK